MMKNAGAGVSLGLPEIRISGKGYRGGQLPIETDWSSAAFWYELMALSEGGALLLRGLKEDSIQGDSIARKYFYMLGVETLFTAEGALIRKNKQLSEVFDYEVSQHPDLAPPLIVSTAAKGLKGNFYGIQGLRIKESDRSQALAEELLKCDVECRIEDDQLFFHGQKMNIKKAINTHNDHRIAMAFAPLAILGDPVTIENPEVVSKSYPNFWNELQKVLDFRHPAAGI
jgi:3-phosphoshikimate 1-carboxyvinyltransferase